MSKRMLIDATHAEETRVVVLDGSRLEDFDIETSAKRQLKGNIYLAKVVRVEPSLQAAFVEYGGNRHGFLAFDEIHPDYYQIPVADRQRLLEFQAEQARLEEEEEELELALAQAQAARASGDGPEAWALPDTPALIAAEPVTETASAETPITPPHESWAGPALPALMAPAEPAAELAEPEARSDPGDDDGLFDTIPEEAPPETIGGGQGAVDAESGFADERPPRRIPSRFLRNYQIQEVIHRRQILLVQVVKEERGTKGAALTSYLSLAGRFAVLMPNSPRGGGISRKITSAADRRRLKELMDELDIPRGMGLIVRTAGAQRPKPEIKRDCEYLLRLWDDIREHTMKSIAPSLVYEEASLIKRAIRDLYSRDIDEIAVDGEPGWRAAHEFMRMLMPSHARKVLLWPESGPSLFSRHQVETQLDSMMQPTVQLRSGGYLVINQAEALVAIDVNSGRSTRERNVEETALRTNLEASDEVARQLRLRDLAGLIVIDFIDMEAKRHNAMVERRLKDALKDDRARIQVGHISHFGLLEMSRQRLRPSLEEATLVTCPHCAGTGHVRGTESAALHVLRGVEEEAGKRRSAEVVVHVATPIALYILNHKRARLNEIEQRYGMRVVIAADDTLIAPRFRIDRVRGFAPGEEPPVVTVDTPRVLPEPIEEEDEEADELEAADGTADDADDEQDRGRRRRRRRRRGGREDGAPAGEAEPVADAGPEPARVEASPVPDVAADDGDRSQRRPRRGRGRRRDGEARPVAMPGDEQPDLPPAWSGPTPADPFGGAVYDIFDVMEQAELNAAQSRQQTRPRRERQERGRWRPSSWSVPSQPPMLAEEAVHTGRARRDPDIEAWALPQRPFMLRRDRHGPRWRDRRVDSAPVQTVPIESGPPPKAQIAAVHTAAVNIAAVAPAVVTPEGLAWPDPALPALASEDVGTIGEVAAAETPPALFTEIRTAVAAVPHAWTVPPVPDLATASEPAPPARSATPVPVAPAEPAPFTPASAQTIDAGFSSSEREPRALAHGEQAHGEQAHGEQAIGEPAAAELATGELATGELVPANDAVAGPLVQPIVIGADASPPAERKRGWWRRR